MLALCLMTLDTQQEKDKLIVIYDTYKKLMLKIAFSVVKDFDFANDIVHDAIFKVVDILDQFDDIYSDKAKNTVAIITKNTAINAIKRRNKINFIEIDSILETENSQFNVEEEAAALILKQKIIAQISELDEKYSSVLQLKFENDFSDKQIARILGISDSLCRKRLHLARKMLKKILMEEGVIDEK